MARPIKDTVEYFPHFVNSKKTIYILEQAYGNDGYAFWFKVLEMLCSNEGHIYDCNNEADWLFLQAKTQVSEDTACKILDTLCNCGAIDKELWSQKIIWSQNLVNNLQPVYANRRRQLPSKPVITCNNDSTDELLHVETTSEVSNELLPTVEMPQSIVEYSKVDNNIAPSDSFIALELNDGTLFHVTKKDVETYQELYPIVNIEQELRNMKGWLLGNPKKKKSRNGIKRFITNWLRGKQDKGSSNSGTGLTQSEMDALKGWKLNG